MKTFYYLTVSLLILFSFNRLQAQSLLDTSRIVQTDVEGDTPVSSDDAEQINDEIDKLFDDDLDMGWEGDEFNIITVGLRFTDIGVPQGAQIDSAFVEIFAHEDEGDPANITIWGQASDDTETFNDTDLITDRPRTTAEVRWEITEDWGIWQLYRSPDFAPVIQEIVDREGWEEGNSLVLVFEGEDQGASNEDNGRDFESFENIEDPDDGGDGLNHPERIPKLYVYYSITSSVDDLIEREIFKVNSTVTNNKVLNVTYDGSLREPLSVGVFNMAGSQVCLLSLNLPAGENQPIRLPDLDTGMYIITAVGGDYRKSTRIFVR